VDGARRSVDGGMGGAAKVWTSFATPAKVAVKASSAPHHPETPPTENCTIFSSRFEKFQQIDKTFDWH